MRSIRVAQRCWLIIDEVYRPRFLIAYIPAVNARTHETHMMYRVQQWALDRRDRSTVGWHETERDAIAYCTAVLTTPDFTTPLRDPDGGVVTTEMQRLRWEQGLDPRTGDPRRRYRTGVRTPRAAGVSTEFARPAWSPRRNPSGAAASFAASTPVVYRCSTRA